MIQLRVIQFLSGKHQQNLDDNKFASQFQPIIIICKPIVHTHTHQITQKATSVELE